MVKYSGSAAEILLTHANRTECCRRHSINTQESPSALTLKSWVHSFYKMMEDSSTIRKEKGRGGVWCFSPAAAAWLSVNKGSLFVNRKLQIATLCQSPAQVGRACDEPRHQ